MQLPNNNLLLTNNALQKRPLMVLSQTINHFKVDLATRKIGAFEKITFLKPLLLEILVTEDDFHEKCLRNFKMFEICEFFYIHCVLECGLKMTFLCFCF